MAHSPLRRVLSVIRRQIDPDASGPAADDRLLARFARNGDASAFELLVWRHGSMVLGVCRRVLGDHQLAEDAFQATFLALARKPKAVRNGASLPGWLHRVARRIAVRARIDNAKRFERDRRAARCELVTHDAFSADTQAVIDEEIDRLPEKLRRAVVLCYLEGQTAEQAAQLLGCPRGTVLSRLAAARERLRVRLTRRGLGVSIGGLAAGLTAAEVSAAVVSATTATALTGGASIQMIGWANGVLYAMFLSKIKFATAAVLTTGIMGAGVGWVAGPGHGTGIGEVQADDKADRQRELAEQARQQAEESKAKLDKGQADLRRAIAQRDATLANLAAETEKANVARLNAEKKLADALAALKRVPANDADAAKKLAQKYALENEELRREISRVFGVLQERVKEGSVPHLKTREALLAETRTEIDELRDRQMVEERKLADQIITRRRRLMHEEERLKAQERLQAVELEQLVRGLADGRTELDRIKTNIAVLREKFGNDHQEVAIARTTQEEIAKRLKEVQTVLADRQAKNLTERLQSREVMVQMEEETKTLERQRALAEQEATAKRAALQDRLRQIGGGANDRIVDLERKLDALMREVSELRRELQK